MITKSPNFDYFISVHVPDVYLSLESWGLIHLLLQQERQQSWEWKEPDQEQLQPLMYPIFQLN